MATRSPGQVAAIDQAQAAVAPLGGKIVDTAVALLVVIVDSDGKAHFRVTTSDLRWVATALRTMADRADERATAAGQ